MRALPVFLLLLLVLPACGGGDLSLRDEVAQAATRTAQEESMRMSYTAELSDPSLGDEPIELSGRGHFAGENGVVTMRVPSSPDLPGGMEVEVVITGTVIYMRMPLLAEALPEQWIELDLQEAGEELGLDFQALIDASKRQSPSEALDQLRAVADVQELGAETVRGVDTRRLRAIVDVERYADLLEDEGEAAAAETIRRTFGLTRQRTIPMELWIDEDDRIRRITWTEAIPADLPKGSPKASVTMTMELYDFGAPVRVERPPADQVMSFEELLELAP